RPTWSNLSLPPNANARNATSATNVTRVKAKVARAAVAMAAMAPTVVRAPKVKRVLRALRAAGLQQQAQDTRLHVLAKPHRLPEAPVAATPQTALVPTVPHAPTQVVLASAQHFLE